MEDSVPARRTRRVAGFSLVELMLALSAFAVFVGALLTGIVSLSAEGQIREERLLAINACRSLMENLRRSDLADVQAANGTAFLVPGIGGAGEGLRPRTGDVDGMPGSITVTPERTYGTEVIYRVTVAVDWTGVTPAGHVHLTTLMGKRR